MFRKWWLVHPLPSQKICWIILRQVQKKSPNFYCSVIYSIIVVSLCVQVDLVCHGKTEIYPDKDGSDPYAVRISHLSHFTSLQWWFMIFFMIIVAYFPGTKKKRLATNCRQWEHSYFRCNCAKDNKKQVTTTLSERNHLRGFLSDVLFLTFHVYVSVYASLLSNILILGFQI